ncbi:MAG: hypothetical protein ACSHX4_03965 [Opitutaceae bacterium]
MYYLAINENTKVVYAGGARQHMDRLMPNPVLVPFAFGQPEGTDPDKHVFLEESFDPVTKIRRGRVYRREDGSYPQYMTVRDPYGKFHVCSESVVIYQRDILNEWRDTSLQKMPTVCLGQAPFFTQWKLIQIEADISRSTLLVLKSYRSFGELPELIEEEIPVVIRKSLYERIEHVESSIHNQTPHNIADRCRDALALIFSHIAECPTADLDEALKKYEKHPLGTQKHLIQHASHVVRMLHSRGKPNAGTKWQTRPLDEAEGQLAVRSLGLVLKDLNWAQ